jgi:uncharacterized protein (TIGR00255 family)
MTRSMTGFGQAVGELDGETISIEVSAVNHRFLESSLRLPMSWASLEPVLREAAKDLVARGKLYIQVRRERGPAGRPIIRYDAEVAGQYAAAANALAGMLNTTERLSLNTLAQLEGVFYHEEETRDLDRVKEVLIPVLRQALEQLNVTRTNEGQALAVDILERIAQMREALAAIETRLPEISQAYEERLRTRIADLAAETGLKEERLALEVALMADKSDVNEEVVRLKAHFAHVEDLLAGTEPAGRDLGFVAQEIQREVNTLGSKLRDIGVTREVLRLKSELEKLREQAQNIE